MLSAQCARKITIYLKDVDIKDALKIVLETK